MSGKLWIVALPAALMLTACGPYLDYDYAPRPGELVIAAQGGQGKPEARLLMSVIGIRRQISDTDKQPAIQLRVHIENLSQDPLVFDPRKLTIVSADLVQFPGPVGDVSPMNVAPGQVGIRDLLYPMPPGKSPGNLNLQALNVHLTVQLGGRDISTSTIFYRIYSWYYYPYYYPYYYGPAFSTSVVVRH